MKKIIKVIFGISFIFYLLALVMLLFMGVFWEEDVTIVIEYDNQKEEIKLG